MGSHGFIEDFSTFGFIRKTIQIKVIFIQRVNNNLNIAVRHAYSVHVRVYSVSLTVKSINNIIIPQKILLRSVITTIV